MPVNPISGAVHDDNDTSAGNAAQTITAERADEKIFGPENERRQPRPNPLSKYSSYTYQLSLYTIAPDAYDTFLQSGRKVIDQLNGAFLLAQSGGINNANSKRAKGFGYDYYIDDLKMKTLVSGKDIGFQSLSVDMSFNIYEPYGFSFMTNLRQTMDDMKAYSKSKNIEDLSNPWRQFFILGIRFLGYDKDGNVMPTSNIEKYYDILIRRMTFKIDGKMVVYRCEAVSLPYNMAFGTKRGMADAGATVVGSTVQDALMGKGDGKLGLLTKLNMDQEELVKAKSIEIPIKYNVEFSNDAMMIANASIVSPADLDKSKYAFTTVKNSLEVNVKAGENATPDPNKRNLVIKNDTPIVQAITQIITQSDYLEKAMTVYSAEETPDPSTDSNDKKTQKTPNKVRWFSIAPIISNTQWDRKRKDWISDITYLIQTYETPVNLSSYAKTSSPYYGALKRYEYWYTGENSEIVRYEQTLNSAYYMVALDPDTNATGAAYGAPGADVSNYTGKRQSAVRTGRVGVGLEAQNNYITSIMDPGGFANAKIEILGDPDYLMMEAIPEKAKYEDKGQQIDDSMGAYLGQVFIEIDFKEAVDYDDERGVMDINPFINFVGYPPEIQRGIRGISYMVRVVNSTFSKGSFKQVLELNLNTFGKTIGTTSKEEPRIEVGKDGTITSTSTTQNQPANSTTTGLKADPGKPSTTGNNTQPTPQPNNQATTQPTNDKGVAVDKPAPASTVQTQGRESGEVGMYW